MTVQYKEFRIKHLPDNLPLLTHKDYVIPADAYLVRPMGTAKAGWKAPVYGKR